MGLVYQNEKTLFTWMMILSVPIWLLLIVGTVGFALVYALMFFIGYCFAQSALISYLKGNAVQITPQQFSDLHAQIAACCQKLGPEAEPDTYLLQMGAAFNAFATRASEQQNGRLIMLNTNSGQIKVLTRIPSVHGQGALILSPSLDEQKHIVWRCQAQDLNEEALPAQCR